MTQADSDLAAVVAAEANLDSPAEAGEIVRAVTGAMADHFEPEAWDLVKEVVPPDLVGDGGGGGSAAQETPKELFMDVADREDMGTAPSARYARIVAEAIRSRMEPEHVERLDEALSDDFLALFETGPRGELTGPPGPTRGGEIDGPVEEQPDRHRQA